MQTGTQLDSAHRPLLSRAQHGDLSAFEKLVELHRDSVYGLGLRMTGSETQALEIAQESFLSAHLHLGQFQDEKDFIAWLYQTAANHALLRLRLLRVTPVADERLTASELNQRSQVQCSGDDWSDDLGEKVNAALRRAIEEATDGLPQGHRETLLLKDVAGLSYEQVAHMTRASISAIKRRLHEARLFLRATIARFYRAQTSIP